MKEIPAFKDSSLLEALDYIDRDLIAEVIDDIKAPDMSAQPERDKRVTRRSIRQVIALAACLMLVSAVIPVVTYVSKNLDIFSGGILGHSTSEATESQDNNTEQESNAHYPMFTPDLEPISDDTVAELKAVWYKMVYDAEYEAYSKLYAGAEGSDEDKDKFSAKAAETFATAYAELLFSPHREDHFRGRYYGTIGDCVIFAINTYLEEEYNFITLGKTTILNDYSFYIFAYKDGVIKSIETAYSDGWLNADDAEKIKERHNKFNTYGYWKIEEQKEYTYAKFVSDLEEISDQKIGQINNALVRESYEDVMAICENDHRYELMYDTSRRIKESQALYAYSQSRNAGDAFIMDKGETPEAFEERFRYYGTFGNCVIWAEVGTKYDLTATEYDIEWHKFYFSSTAVIKVYSGGKIYDPQTAFDKGLLTIDDVRKLHDRYFAYEVYLTSASSDTVVEYPNYKEEHEIYYEVTEGGWVVFNGGNIITGEDLWHEFYSSYLKSEPASVQIANYYPLLDTIYLTTIVYNGNQIQQSTENRQNGMLGVKATGVYKYIIQYDGEPLDKNDTIHDHEEVYILVNDNTLTYQKIKESSVSINHFTAFSKLSYLDDTPVSFNITAEQDAILSNVFGNTYNFASGKWKNYIDGSLTAKEADIWNCEAPSDIISILDFLVPIQDFKEYGWTFRLHPRTEK